MERRPGKDEKALSSTRALGLSPVGDAELAWAAAWRMGPRRTAPGSGRPLGQSLSTSAKSRDKRGGRERIHGGSLGTQARRESSRAGRCGLERGDEEEPHGSLPGFQLLLAAGGGAGRSLLAPPLPPAPNSDHEECWLLSLPHLPSSDCFPGVPGEERGGDEIMEQRGLEPHFFPSPQWKTLSLLGEGSFRGAEGA